MLSRNTQAQDPQEQLTALEEQVRRLQQENAELRGQLETLQAQDSARSGEEARLQAEMQARRAQMQQTIEAQVRAFSDTYNYYLSQLRLMMTVITQAAGRTGANFLQTPDVDAGEMLRGYVSDDLARTLQRNAAPVPAAVPAAPEPAAAAAAQMPAAAAKV